MSEPIRAADQEAVPSIVYFTNGRALRVAAYRVEGDWAYLTVSVRDDPEEKPSEMGVRASSVARVEVDDDAVTRGGNGRRDRTGRAANGPMPITSSGLPMARVNGPVGGSVPSVPASGSPEARKYLPRSTSPDIDPTKAGAGHVFYEPLRHLKVPRRYIDAADRFEALKRKQKELDRAAAAEGKKAPNILPPVRLPAGYIPPSTPDSAVPAGRPAADGSDSSPDGSGS
ncbi:MAG: hypothetical protein ACE5IK_12260 [Acidobacteriota bacterium]